MKRPSKLIIGAAMALALTGAAMAAVVWIVATTPGARWLLTSLSPLGGVSFSAQKVEGRLIDHLLLTELKIGLAQQKIAVDRLELRWQPILLLEGIVAVQELSLQKVRIQDDAPSPDQPPTLAWPQVSGNTQLSAVKIAHLLVTDLSYRRRQEQPVRVTALAGSVTWQDRLLSLNNLMAVSPAGRISGAIAAGFKQPSLTADLALALAQPLAGMEQFSLQARQSPAPGPEPFIATLTVHGKAGKQRRLELSAEVGMAANAINLRRLSLTRPGQKGLLTGEGSLAFTARESVLSLQVKAADLDLAPELQVPTDLSGTLSFAGTLNSYRGDFTLTNQAQGWQAAVVSATYQGTTEGLKLTPVTAAILDGTLAGKLAADWRHGLALQWEISGRDLNPARLAPDWQGVANFTASGELTWAAEQPLTGKIRGALLGSRLHGQALTGALEADLGGNSISLARLDLQGKGFELHASGELNRRLTLAAKISDFSNLVPGSTGTLQADGWLRWRDRQLSGAITGTGNRLTYADTRIGTANLTARLDQSADAPLHFTATLGDVVYDAYKLQTATLVADGTLAHHRVDATFHAANAEARLTLAAGYTAGTWAGELTHFAGRDQSGVWSLAAPATYLVSASKFTLSPLALTAGAAERLEVAADLGLNPLSGQLRTQWTDLNLARANGYLKEARVSGRSHGTAQLGFLPDRRLGLAGEVAGSGTFSSQGQTITFQPSRLTFAGSEQGLRANLELSTTGGGSLTGSYTSTAPLRLVWPESGELTAELSNIDLTLLKPWLPSGTSLEGRLSCKAKGSILPDQRFALDGEAGLTGGTLHQARPDGELNFTTSSATATWSWRGEALSTSLALTMAEHGQVRATGQLPIPARFPVVVNRQGPLQATLTGQLQEKGLITALLPGLVQESSGELDAELAVSGSWAAPQLGGKVRLSKAGAYLPTAGIHLQEVELTAGLDKNLIRIDSFRARSGPGHLEGTAQITLDGWRVTGYQGTIDGENFQTIYFPELQILSTPKLTFTGTPQKITLRGELQLPKLQVVGAPSRTAIGPSSDVIRTDGAGATTPKSSPLVWDVQVRVGLGEEVSVKIAGIDAQLGGAVDLALTSLDRITSKGEIKVAKGRYRTYGVNLEIVRGRLYFAGGPINRPTLDFLALRTIGDVRAGVTVAGTLQNPVTKLYSEPPMPDADVLAYIVLGHPLGSDGQQASLVVQAAGALLSTSQAEALQAQIKSRLGLSTLEITGGVGGSASYMGYKPLQVTPPGAIPAGQQPGITETVLTVGKYLTPQLYISYGKSLFTGSNLFRLRYDIYKQWQIETQTGSESGADLFYKLEFK